MAKYMGNSNRGLSSEIKIYHKLLPIDEKTAQRSEAFIGKDILLKVYFTSIL
jgi:hypothetical protein